MAIRPPNFMRIPSGTKPVRCRWCPKDIYWITTVSGKRMPVDASVEGGIAPSPTADGRGIAHQATCPGWQRPAPTEPG